MNRPKRDVERESNGYTCKIHNMTLMLKEENPALDVWKYPNEGWPEEMFWCSCGFEKYMGFRYLVEKGHESLQEEHRKFAEEREKENGGG